MFKRALNCPFELNKGVKANMNYQEVKINPESKNKIDNPVMCKLKGISSLRWASAPAGYFLQNRSYAFDKKEFENWRYKKHFTKPVELKKVLEETTKKEEETKATEEKKENKKK